MKDIKDIEKERKKITDFLELEINNFKEGVYSEESGKPVKENMIKALAKLPNLERTVYKLEMIVNNIFIHLDLETELDLAIREARHKIISSKDATAITSKSTHYEIDQKKLDMLLENAIPDKGFLRDYVNVFSEVTDCPKSFLLWGALVMVATVLGKNMYIKYIAEKIRPNIWCVFLADSGSRKGTGINLVINLLSRVDIDLLLPTVASEEGLIRALDTSKKSGRDIGFIHWQEFATILRDWKKQNSWKTSKEFLMKVYDGVIIKKQLSKEEFNVKDTAINFIGACIPMSFNKYFSLEDLESGFFARVFLISVLENEKYYPLPGEVSDIAINRLVMKLKEIGDRYDKRKMSYEAIADKFSIWARSKRKEKESSHLKAFYARIETSCLKLSMIYHACLDGEKGNDIISEEAFEYATKAMDFLIASGQVMVSEHIGISEEQRLTREVEEYIRKRKKVFKADIFKKFKLQWKVLSDIEKTLIEKESIYIMNLKPLPGSGPGRSKVVYVAIN
ncbi:hypothetical protein ES705_18577 [subsurface metagenome]